MVGGGTGEPEEQEFPATIAEVQERSDHVAEELNRASASEAAVNLSASEGGFIEGTIRTLTLRIRCF